MSYANPQTATEITLEMVQECAHQIVSGNELAMHQGLTLDARFTTFLTPAVDMMLTASKQVPAFTRYQERTVLTSNTVPADWWQAVRHRWAPKWWTKRHPVKTIEFPAMTQVNIKRIYPCPHGPLGRRHFDLRQGSQMEYFMRAREGTKAARDHEFEQIRKDNDLRDWAGGLDNLRDARKDT